MGRPSLWVPTHADVAYSSYRVPLLIRNPFVHPNLFQLPYLMAFTQTFGVSKRVF